MMSSRRKPKKVRGKWGEEKENEGDQEETLDYDEIVLPSLLILVAMGFATERSKDFGASERLITSRPSAASQTNFIHRCEGPALMGCHPDTSSGSI